MIKLLQINSSIFSANGESSQLANAFVQNWQQVHPDTSVIVHDLAEQPIPHLDYQHLVANSTPVDQRTPEQQALAAGADALLTELLEADVLVLGVPMYNFAIPSSLKAYFDIIARAGVTFRYTENGPVGLLTNKKVFVFATRGGVYQGTNLDTQTKYLQDFLGFLGLDAVQIVYAEGLNMGEALKQQALTAAHEQLTALAV